MRPGVKSIKVDLGEIQPVGDLDLFACSSDRPRSNYLNVISERDPHKSREQHGGARRQHGKSAKLLYYFCAHCLTVVCICVYQTFGLVFRVKSS